MLYYRITMVTTKQVEKKVPNPTGKGGFQERPQDRNNGSWVKSDTPRYKLEQMMKLSEDELNEIASDKGLPLFENKLAIAIIEGNWNVIKEMTQEVYGKPKEIVDVTTNGESLIPTVKIIDERPKAK